MLEFVESALPMPYAPRPSSFTQTFWRELEAGRLTTTRCTACGALTFPPRPYCPACSSDRHEWTTLSGQGRLYSRTRVHAAAGPFARLVPYSIGVIDLQEGVRMLASLLSPATALPLDAAIRIVVVRHCDGVLFAATSDC